MATTSKAGTRGKLPNYQTLKHIPPCPACLPTRVRSLVMPTTSGGSCVRTDMEPYLTRSGHEQLLLACLASESGKVVASGPAMDVNVIDVMADLVRPARSIGAWTM